MLSFIDILKTHYDLLIYFFIGLIFVFFFVIIFLINNKKKKHTNRLEELKAIYKKIDELPIINAINKIEELANRNISFSSMHTNYLQRYLEYGNKFNQPITEMITSINALINDAKYDIAKEKIDSLEVLINAYKKDAESLMNDIKDATSDEAPLLSEIERVRALYSECIKRYQDNAHDLVLVENNIRNRLQNISNLINECEDNIQSGIYIDTRELLYKIDEELDVLAEYLRVMPQLINYANTVYHSLNEVIEKTNIMHADYQIHHLKPFARIDRLKIDLSKSLERIKMLDHMGVEVLLREIHNNVIDLNTSLDHEKECKKEYDSKCENLYYISDCTIRNFDHIKKEIETVLKDFATTEEITLFLSKCDEFKVQLKKDKQIMDNNIYGHQPYSVRLENMNKLNETIEAFQSHLDSFANVAKNLENDKNECIGKINGYINYLRQSQIILDNCNLPALVKRYREKVNNIEELISKLFISLRKPYKVKVAKDICNILDVECKDLYGKVRYSQRLMVFVEKIIVIASRYRDKFQEVDYAVNRASFYFLEGDFEASRNIVEKLSSYGIVFPKFSEIEA